MTLYWHALDFVGAERTVSVRIANENGQLLAQKDMQPNNGGRPTSWWEPGWKLRDTYYLTIDQNAGIGKGTLDIVLYDSYSGDLVPLGTNDVLTLLPVLLE